MTTPAQSVSDSAAATRVRRGGTGATSQELDSSLHVATEQPGVDERYDQQDHLDPEPQALRGANRNAQVQQHAGDDHDRKADEHRPVEPLRRACEAGTFVSHSPSMRRSMTISMPRLIISVTTWSDSIHAYM